MNLILGHACAISIAGVPFTISSKDLSICHPSADPYGHFISTDLSSKHKDPVTVELLLDKMPDVAGFEKVFDTKGSWALFTDGERKYILFRGPDHDAHPLWVADIDMKNRHVDVYCGKRLKSRLDSGQPVIINPLGYPLDQILLMQFMDGNGFTVHAAGAIHHGNGYVFAGPSGAGKSTISMLLSNFEEFTLLSDDRIVIRQTDGKFSMYGTPWPGDAGIAVNSKVPLRKIFFLEKGKKNMLRELTPQEAFAKIMPVVSLPWYDEVQLTSYLETCGKVLEHTRSYVLSFTSDPGTAHELIGIFNG